MKARASVLMVTVIVLMVAVGSGGIAFPLENLSSGRGLGLGVGVSLPPWPFVSYFFSDQVGISATGVLLPGVLALSASLEYRILDNQALDVLAYSGVTVATLVVIPQTFFSAGAILEYSFSRSLVLRGSLGATLSLLGLHGLQPTYGLSVVYYF